MPGSEDPLSTVLDEVATAVPRLVTRTRRQLQVGRNVLTLVVCRRLPPAPRSVPEATRERVPITVVDVAAEDWAPPGGDTRVGAVAARPSAGPVGPADTDASASAPLSDASVAAQPLEPPPPASELALEDYDALAASQVVPRLASLSTDELELVRRYERSHRNRQTILHRVDQLLDAPA